MRIWLLLGLLALPACGAYRAPIIYPEPQKIIWYANEVAVGKILFNLLKSNFAKSAFLINALNNVFTPVIAENSNLLMVLTMPGISRGFVIKIFNPPILLK